MSIATAAVPTLPALVLVRSEKFGTVPNFSDLTSTSAGSVGTAAVALDNHNITMTPGTGTGIVITGQFVVDLTIE